MGFGARIGRLDIVMAPVDGTMTLDLKKMIGILKRLKARISSTGCMRRQ